MSGLPECPLPLSDYPEVTMAHGGGGRLMHRLVEELFLSVFGAPPPGARADAATLDLPGRRLAMTTDAHVVSPLFFPGGDIGSLSVHGTVNDLAVSGARPLWLSAGFVLEEGLPMETLWRVVLSMGRAAEESGVSVVTGDTKVVERGKADGLYITTTGVGAPLSARPPIPDRIEPGDAIIVSGDLGRHGIAVLSAREGMDLAPSLASDLAPLADVVAALYGAGLEPHCMRDLTRGGLASGLHETVGAAGLSALVHEELVPVREGVAGACEILGLDPVYLPNEGRLVLFLPERDAGRALSVMSGFPVCERAAVVGDVGEPGAASVVMRTVIGSDRVLDMLSGEQLPRIC